MHILRRIVPIDTRAECLSEIGLLLHWASLEIDFLHVFMYTFHLIKMLASAVEVLSPLTAKRFMQLQTRRWTRRLTLTRSHRSDTTGSTLRSASQGSPPSAQTVGNMSCQSLNPSSMYWWKVDHYQKMTSG